MKMNSTSEQIVLKLKIFFARFRILEVLVSDNGPQFVYANMQEFASACDVHHITTSPHFLQANGEAESGVQIAKCIIQQPDPFIALLNYRATPITVTGVNPAQLLMGKSIHATLLVLQQNLDPNWLNLNKMRKQDQKTNEI